MYKLEVRPAPDSDASEDEYHFVVNDLVSSIESILDIEENMITKDGNRKNGVSSNIPTFAVKIYRWHDR